MTKNRLLQATVGGVLTAAAWLAAVTPLSAQVTNWIAFNDHRATTTPVANGWAITGPNVSIYDMGAPADTAGALTDYLTGDALVANVTFTRTGAPDDFGTVARPMRTNTPMARLFYGICDFANDGIVGVRGLPQNATESWVTVTFSGLDPSKRYVFRGSASRNGGYGNRWSMASIAASGWTDAHIAGDGGPGVLTVNNFPATAFAQGQAAWNSGANNEGAVVGWNDIAPFEDGTFTITNQQYTGAIPGGTANGPYGYGFSGFMLAEVEVVAPTIVANPTATISVEQNRRLTLSVEATGAPLNYRWFKDSTEIAGATFSTYTVSQASLDDSGTYYVEVYNSLGTVQSSSSAVTVFADTAAPSVETIFSYPTVDAGGVAVLDQIIVEFSEAVTPESVSSPFSYGISGGIGGPISVVVTNERSVVLVLGTPLAEDTDYTVTLSGATDLVGNTAGSSSPSLHSWVSGSGNGLLFEAFNVEEAGNTVESLLADPDFPNNPDRSETLSAFDSRLVYPADDSRIGYGARISGVFIPPVSGDWVFFARTRQLGVVNLNPNGTDASGKVEILRQSTENAPYNWDRLSSSLIPLRAGKAYYIEGLYRGDTISGYMKVAARLAGTGTPLPVDSLDTDAPDANALAGAPIAFPLAPRNLGGVLSIAQDLADRTADENNPTTLSVGVSNPGGLPLHYQWFRDGLAIPGETKPTYTFLPRVDTDNGATFSVEVSKFGATVMSRTATLTVVPDVTGPIVLEAFSTNLTHVVVRFNELVEPFSAQEPFSYTILEDNPAATTLLLPDGTSVLVEMSTELVAGQTYQLSVADVTDLSFNVMSPNPTIVTFIAGVVGPRLDVESSGAQVTLSWPVTPSAFVLEEASSLLEPSGATVWTAVNATPSVVGGRYVVSIDKSPGSRFYRLRQ